MFDYVPGDSLLHRLDVRVKVIAFILLTVVAFIYKHPLYNFGLAFAVSLIYVYMKVPFKHVWKILKPLMPIFVIIIAISGFTYPASQFSSVMAQEVLFYGWFNQGLPFTYGGLFFGIILLFRIYSMVVLTSILTVSTPLDDFIQMMDAMRLPQPITFIVVTGIRFIPTMQKKVDQVYDAQRARGAKLSGDGIIGQIIAFVPVMVPLIVDSIRMSESLAMSMLNRGYGASKRRTALKALRMEALDYFLLVVVIVLIGSLVFLRVRGYGAL